MPAVDSSWLVGSITIPAQSFTANGFACSIPAGTYYLRHATSALSLIVLFATEVENQTGVSANGVTLKRSRLIADSWTAPVSINWGAATQLQLLFGHTGNLAASTDHLAPNVSPLLWSPGFPGSPTTVVGASGYSKPHQAHSKSDDGTKKYVYHFGKETWQELDWSHIVASRLRVITGTGGGTFHEFYEQCAMLGSQFFHYSVTEDSADSSTDVTWGTGLGPYVLRENFDGDWYKRRVPGGDISSPLTIPLQIVSEYS